MGQRHKNTQRDWELFGNRKRRREAKKAEDAALIEKNKAEVQKLIDSDEGKGQLETSKADADVEISTDKERTEAVVKNK